MCLEDLKKSMEIIYMSIPWINQDIASKDDFEDSEIDYFQTKADNLYLNWIKLHGIDGVTNYFHMIGSGHILYCLRKWRNLYRYSQQGW